MSAAATSTISACASEPVHHVSSGAPICWLDDELALPPAVIPKAAAGSSTLTLVERPSKRAVLYLRSLTLGEFKKQMARESPNKTDPTMQDSELEIEFRKMRSFCNKTIRKQYTVTREYTYSLQMEEYWSSFADKYKVEAVDIDKGGRLYSGGSIQGMHSTYRGLLLGGLTTDLDMGNAHPTILLYLCRQHGINCPTLETLTELLTAAGIDRGKHTPELRGDCY